MDENEVNRRLTRITIGGIEQLPNFTGDKKDYTSIINVEAIAHKTGERLWIYGLRPPSIFYPPRKYEPKNLDSFLQALDGILEEQGLNLIYCNPDRTHWRELCTVRGELIVLKEKRITTKPL